MTFQRFVLAGFSAVMMLLLAPNVLGAGSCVWNSIAVGNVQCRPAEPVVPSSVAKKIGVKGRFYKQYMDFVKKCNAASAASCPKGCVRSRGMCSAPSVYQYFACPTSAAEQYYTCSGAAESECRMKKCLWNAQSSSCSPPTFSEAVSKLLISQSPRNNEVSAYTPTSSLSLWQQAFGTCSFSTYLFNRQVCSSLFTGSPYTGLNKATCAKFKHCTWFVDPKSPSNAGCVLNAYYAGEIWYGSDIALTYWAAPCNAVPNEERCRGVLLP